MNENRYTQTIEPIVFSGRSFSVRFDNAAERSRIETHLLTQGGTLTDRNADYLVCEQTSVSTDGVTVLTPVQYWVGAQAFDQLRSEDRMEEVLIFLSSATPFPSEEAAQVLWYIRENREAVIQVLLEKNLTEALKGFLSHSREVLPSDYGSILDKQDYDDQILLDLVDELLEQATALQKHELTAWLLEYKQNHISAQFAETVEQERLEKELGICDRNTYDWMKLFRFTTEPDGVHIWDYKGSDETVFIPEQIDEQPVVSINLRQFYASPRELRFFWERPFAPSADWDALARAQVHDIVHFGHYPQSKTGEFLPIAWQVLAKENNRLLVVSQYCLDKLPFHLDYKKTSWAECDLRKWLNSTFFQLAFAPQEQARIPAVDVEIPDNEKYKTAGCGTTSDHIFVLSAQEAETLFASNEDRIGYTTLYAQVQGFYFGGKINCWWLRTPGVSAEFTTLVGNSGSVGIYGYRVDHNEYAIRPAMWITLDEN